MKEEFYMKGLKKVLIFVLILGLTASYVPNVAAGGRAVPVRAVFSSVSPETLNMTVNPVMKTTPEVVEKGGQNCYKLTVGGDSVYDIFFNIDDDVLYRVKPEETIEVDVTYFDEGYGGFFFEYDGRYEEQAEFVQCMNTRKFVTKTFTLYDAYFANRLKGSDFSVVTEYKTDYANIKSPVPVYIRGVEVRTAEMLSPYDISLSADKVGNIFYENEDVAFSVNCKNNDGILCDGLSLKYSICDSDGNLVTEKVTTPASDGLDLSDKVTFENLPFGVYKLNIELYGKGVSVKCDTDFSYSKYAELNKSIGMNEHLNDNIYELDDLKKLIDLTRASGIGAVRCAVDWHMVQPEKDGEFSLPDNFEFFIKYLDAVGIDHYAGITCGNRQGFGTLERNYHELGETKDGIAAFKKYCEFVANCVKDYSEGYAIIDEFDMCGVEETGLSGDGYDAPSDESYVNLLKAAYEAIKSVHPDGWVNGGNMAIDPSWQFTDYKGKYTWDTRAYERGMLNFCDSISYQRFSAHSAPEVYDLNRYINYGKVQVDKYKGDSEKELWVTGNGWATREFELPSGLNPSTSYWCTSEKKQGMWYPRLYAINSGKDRIAKHIGYEFFDDMYNPFDVEANYGIVHAKDYKTPYAAKPAFVSIAAFNSIVGEAETAVSKGDNVTINDVRSASTRSEIVYEITNKKDEKITCVWRAESAPEKIYTVDTNMPYAEVYDYYGNLTDVIEGGVVQIHTRPDIQYVKGVKKPTGKVAVKQGGMPIDSVWCIQDNEEISISFKPDATFRNGDKVTLICAGYNGDLMNCVSSKQFEFSGDEIVYKISPDTLKNSDRVAFFAFDGFENIKPLAAAPLITNFSDNSKITVKRDGDIYTVSGVDSRLVNSECVTVSVFSSDTIKDGLTDKNYNKKCIYQDFVNADGAGAYSITFKTSDTAANGIGILVTAKDFSMQTAIY